MLTRHHRAFFGRNLRHGPLCHSLCGWHCTRRHGIRINRPSCHRARYRRAFATHVTLHLHATAVVLFPGNQVASTLEGCNLILDFHNFKGIHLAAIHAQVFFESTDFRIFVQIVPARYIARRISLRRHLFCTARRHRLQDFIRKVRHFVRRPVQAELVIHPVTTTVKRSHLVLAANLETIRLNIHRIVVHVHTARKRTLQVHIRLHLGHTASIYRFINVTFDRFLFLEHRLKPGSRLHHKLEMPWAKTKRNHQNQTDYRERNANRQQEFLSKKRSHHKLIKELTEGTSALNQGILRNMRHPIISEGEQKRENHRQKRKSHRITNKASTSRNRHQGSPPQHKRRRHDQRSNSTKNKCQRIGEHLTQIRPQHVSTHATIGRTNAAYHQYSAKAYQGPTTKNGAKALFRGLKIVFFRRFRRFPCFFRCRFLLSSQKMPPQVPPKYSIILSFSYANKVFEKD